MTTVAFPVALFEELRSWLALDVETAGVISLRPGDDGRLLLARSLFPVPDEAYRARERDFLDIASSGYVPALKQAALDGAVAAFVHSHPGGLVQASHLDDGVDAELRLLFPARTGRDAYVSLIVGGDPDSPTISGRLYRSHAAPESIERFRVVGPTIRLLTSESAVPAEAFDRQIRAFGADGQQLFQRLRVGVVGLGGTGSAVAEQLIRLGVGELTLADDDQVSRSNLRRIHQSTMADVGEAKVAVAARLGAQLEPGSRIRTICGRITDEQVARAFAGCDVIFGCTDDHAGRAVLSRLAYWYLVPVIDMGVVIDSAEGALRDIYLRLTNVGPGFPCLICRDVVDPIRMRNESLAPEERVARVAEGYAPELHEPDPSVVTYTTMVASLAVSELLSRLFALGQNPGQLLLRVSDHRLAPVAGDPRVGHYCHDSAYWGRGDEEPFLGQTW